MSNPDQASGGAGAQDERIARFQQRGYSITATLDDGSVILSKPGGYSSLTIKVAPGVRAGTLRPKPDSTVIVERDGAHYSPLALGLAICLAAGVVVATFPFSLLLIPAGVWLLWRRGKR